MNSRERCLEALDFKLPDRIPVVPQCFLPACNVAGYKISEINRNGRLMAKTHIICHEKFGYDGIVVDVDDATLAEACGAKVIFRENDVAVVDDEQPVLRDLKDIYDLELPDPYKDGRLPEWLEATKTLKEELGDEVFIMGRADQGPFDLACLLRGAHQFLMDLLLEDPDDIFAVLDYCRRAGTLFAKAQKDCGSDATSIGEAYASSDLISPQMYRDIIFPHDKKMAEEVQAYGIPFSLHICGNSTPIIGDMLNTGSRILEIDWKTDMGEAKKTVGNNAVLMGNIDPSDPLVWGTPDAVKQKAKEIIDSTGGRGIFLSSGCAMGANTPDENMKAMVDAALEYGTRERMEELNSNM